MGKASVSTRSRNIFNGIFLAFSSEKYIHEK